MKGFCSAYLGYYLFTGFEGRGLMTEALTVVMGFCFSEIGLHRLEANIQPQNEASKRLVEECGFINEGYSRKYLKIGDEWRDHERWAIIAEDWDTKNSK
jgi:ribosomal-protein-alanine N-acetyltransferase